MWKPKTMSLFALRKRYPNRSYTDSYRVCLVVSSVFRTLHFFERFNGCDLRVFSCWDSVSAVLVVAVHHLSALSRFSIRGVTTRGKRLSRFIIRCFSLCVVEHYNHGDPWYNHLLVMLYMEHSYNHGGVLKY